MYCWIVEEGGFWIISHILLQILLHFYKTFWISSGLPRVTSPDSPAPSRRGRWLPRNPPPLTGLPRPFPNFPAPSGRDLWLPRTSPPLRGGEFTSPKPGHTYIPGPVCFYISVFKFCIVIFVFKILLLYFCVLNNGGNFPNFVVCFK